MDYKKKYGEALENFKKIKSANKDNKELVDFIEYEYPELKESEDEKIRKEMIDFFKDAKQGLELQERDNNQWQIERFETFLSWLEKQGEQKLLNNDKYQTVSVEILDRLYESEKELERLKKGEQKPTDKVEPKFKVKYAGNWYNVFDIKESAGVQFYGIEDEPNHIDYILPDNCEIVRVHGYGVKENGSPYPTKSAIFSEQKSAWSEEDECYMSECIGAIATKDGWSFEEKRKTKHWLKSLKQRIGV